MEREANGRNIGSTFFGNVSFHKKKKKKKSKLEIFRQSTASPDVCPNHAISDKGNKQWALLSAPVVHRLLTEGEK